MNTNIMGVYKITNTVNNKIYIGSSIDVKGRIKGHKRDLRKNRHINKHLQRSWNKYGEGNFIFEIIELCSTNDNLLVREQYYIDKYMSYDINIGYNINKTAGSNLGMNHTQEAKIKMSNAMKFIEKNESLNTYELDEVFINKNEVDEILKIKKKNNKNILFALLIQSKRFNTKSKWFHMSYSTINKVTGLSERSIIRNIKDLEELNVIEVFRSNKIVFYNQKPKSEKNKYKLNINIDNKDNIVNEYKEFKVCDRNCTGCFYVCLCNMYSNKELQKMCTRDQYENIKVFRDNEYDNRICASCE